jgi:hypothetical protein
VDAERRAAGRRSEASGDVADQARLLVARLRAGELTFEQVELMAYVGDPAASAAVSLGPLPEYPVLSGTGQQRQLGQGWALGRDGSRALGLWADELVTRFGDQVGVRAALLAAGRAWERGRAPAADRLVTRAHLAVGAWLERPDGPRAGVCERAGYAIDEPEGPGAQDLWTAVRLCSACDASTRREYGLVDVVFALTNAVKALAQRTGDAAVAEADLREAIRAGLVPWAAATPEVVTDAKALAARARAAMRTDPRVATELATRALARARARAGPKGSIDPALLTLRAETRRAGGDLTGALGDADGALAIDARHTPGLRMRGLVQVDLARLAPEAERAVHERHAITDLEAYLDRVLVQVTSSDEGTRLIGPAEAEEAKSALARLKGPG